MPTHPFSAPVVVTGASGFIASWIVKYLLDEGATVHATVRSLGDSRRVAHLKTMGQQGPGKLVLFEGELLQPNSFLKAMHGAAGVIHTASPFNPSKVRDAQAELIRPALEGTRNVLGAVEQTPSIERVVLTSSMAALYGDARDIEGMPGHRVDEGQWNSTSTEHHQPYPYSKTVAERAAWQLAEAQHRWNLVTILPGFALGPSCSERTDAVSTDTILQMIDGRLASGVPDLRFAMVDVRDVARAHIEALRRTSVEGRCLVAAESLGFGDLITLIRARYPDRKSLPARCLPSAMLYLAGPFMGMSWRYLHRNLGVDIPFDNSKSVKELGLIYSPVRDAVGAQVEQLLARDSHPAASVQRDTSPHLEVR